MKIKTIYARPRMDKLLAGMTDYPLTCVVAGAGYGKTTAAQEYLKKATIPYAWITLTGGDAEVLWDKLCTAVESHSKAAADALRALGLPTGAWQVSQAVKLVRVHCHHPFVICIDDYQFLPDDSPVHSLIETIAFEAVPNLHLLLLSRAQPNIRLYTLISKEMALWRAFLEAAEAGCPQFIYLAKGFARAARFHGARESTFCLKKTC